MEGIIAYITLSSRMLVFRMRKSSNRRNNEAVSSFRWLDDGYR